MRHFSFSNYHSLIYSALDDANEKHKQVLDEIAELKKDAKLNEQEKLISLHEFGIKLEKSRIVIILLSCSFIEALANFYISLKCKSEQFKILERASLLDKWVIVPSIFVSEYQFSKSGELYRDLQMLNETRNQISHSKPKVIVDGQINHKGYLPEIPKSSSEFVDKITSLPLRLVKHLSKFDKSEDVTTLLMTSGFGFKAVVELRTEN